MIEVRTKGNLADFAAKIRKAQSVVPAAVLRQAPPGIASQFTSLAQAAFDSGLTADGSGRPPGKNGPVSLVQSGALRGSIVFEAAGRTVVCSLDSKAAYLGRFGILPSSLPTAWAEAADGIVSQAASGAADAI